MPAPSGVLKWKDDLLDPLAVGFLGGDLLHGVLVAQVHATLFVDLRDLDPHHVADLAGILHLLDAMVGQLGDVHQTVLAGSQLHEGTEGHQAHHAAVVQLANLGDKHDVVNALLGGVAGGGVGCGDVDGAVIVNVDLGAGIGHDLLDDRTALAEQLVEFKKDVDELIEKGEPKISAILLHTT